MGENCPCDSSHSYNWHKRHGIPQCTYSKELKARDRDAHRERVRAGIPAWVPGTDIEIPEFEEL